MTSILTTLTCAMLGLYALVQFDEALRTLRASYTHLQRHFLATYRLSACGSLLSAHENLAVTLARLEAIAPTQHKRWQTKAETYRRRLAHRLAPKGWDATHCRQLRFARRRLMLYEQNPAEPSHWPNWHYTLTDGKEDHHG